MPTKRALLWLAFFLVAASPLALRAFQSTATVINSLPTFSGLNVTPDDDSSTAGIQIARPSSGNKQVSITFNASDLNGYLDLNQSTGKCSLSNSSGTVSETSISWSSCNTINCPGTCFLQIHSSFKLVNYTVNASVNESSTNRSTSKNATIEITGTSGCGDGVCEGSETCNSCTLDCGECNVGSGRFSAGRVEDTGNASAKGEGLKIEVIVKTETHAEVQVTKATEGSLVEAKLEIGKQTLPTVTRVSFYAVKPIAYESLSMQVSYQKPSGLPEREGTLLAAIQLKLGSGDSSKIGSLSFTLRVPKKLLEEKGLPFDSLGAKAYSKAKLAAPGREGNALAESGGGKIFLQEAEGDGGVRVPIVVSGSDGENYYYVVKLSNFASVIEISSTVSQKEGKPAEEVVREQRIFEKNETIDNVGEISVRKEYAVYTHKKEGKIVKEDTIVLIKIRSNAAVAFTNIRVRELVTPAFLAHLPEVTFSEQPEFVEQQRAISWSIPKLPAYEEHAISYLVHRRVFQAGEVFAPEVTIEVPTGKPTSSETGRLLVLALLLAVTAVMAYAMQHSLSPEKMRNFKAPPHAKERARH